MILTPEPETVPSVPHSLPRGIPSAASSMLLCSVSEPALLAVAVTSHALGDTLAPRIDDRQSFVGQLRVCISTSQIKSGRFSIALPLNCKEVL